MQLLERRMIVTLLNRFRGPKYLQGMLSCVLSVAFVGFTTAPVHAQNGSQSGDPGIDAAKKYIKNAEADNPRFKEIENSKIVIPLRQITATVYILRSKAELADKSATAFNTSKDPSERLVVMKYWKEIETPLANANERLAKLGAEEKNSDLGKLVVSSVAELKQQQEKFEKVVGSATQGIQDEKVKEAIKGLENKLIAFELQQLETKLELQQQGFQQTNVVAVLTKLQNEVNALKTQIGNQGSQGGAGSATRPEIVIECEPAPYYSRSGHFRRR